MKVINEENVANQTFKGSKAMELDLKVPRAYNIFNQALVITITM